MRTTLPCTAAPVVRHPAHSLRSCTGAPEIGTPELRSCAGAHRIGARLLLLAALVIALAGCRGPLPTIEPEVSDESLVSVEQVGTAALWDDVWADAQRDGRDRIALLDRGDEALAIRVNMIRSARESIRLQSYIWTNCEAGRLLAWELWRAIKQRGVHVQILTDAIPNIHDPEARARTLVFDERVELKVFNPTADHLLPSGTDFLAEALGDFQDLNARMHNKLMVVDDRIAITGGRNIANEYFDRTLGLNFKDRDVLVIGPSVADASRSFDEYWNSNRSVDSEHLEDVIEAMETVDDDFDPRKTLFELNNLFATVDRRASDPGYVRRTFIDTLYAVSSIEWVADHPAKIGTGETEAETSAALRALFREAERSILIQTPYFINRSTSARFVNELREAHPELEITVSTNSLAAADHEITWALLYQQLRYTLEDLGINLWLLKPIPGDIHELMAYEPLLVRKPTPDEAADLHRPRFNVPRNLEPYPVSIDDPLVATLARDEDVELSPDGTEVLIDRRRNIHTDTPPYLGIHAKTVVIDDVAFIGSFNLTPRSVDLNTEIAVIVRDPEFAAVVRRSIERDIAPRNSYLVAPIAYPPGVWEINSLPYRFFEVMPIDIWPFRYATCYELRDGMEPVPVDDPEFSRHWVSRGEFPLVRVTSGSVPRVWLYKTFGLFLKPYL
jgi:phosphatidylserine/phosphatidylglycerophosphate/cardiolipin synthase-like enzyme